MVARMFSRTLTLTVVVIAALAALALVGGVSALPDRAFANGAALDAGADASLQTASVYSADSDSTLKTSASTAKPAKPAKKQLKAFKKASADFSLELFNRCIAAKGENANVTVAPMSVMTALSIAANGAKGKTARQMRAVLGDGATMTQINQNLSWYNSRLTNAKKAKLRSANAIWYHKASYLKMRKAFMKAVKRYYQANISSADFSDPATVASINAWVAKQTNNMIKRVLDNLDKQDRIAIVNALYFDAEWADPYERGSAVDAAFRTASGKKRTVQMLHGVERTYIRGKNVTGFMKPYAAGYSYVALLPKKGMSLKEYASTLDGTTFRRLIANATPATVYTALPKYSISYSNDEMEKQLTAMGMTKAFAPDADFTGMATDSTGNLYLGKVVHKTKLRLDEKGTKAAAVTAVVAKANAAFDPDAKSVTLNRPFIYAIVDNTTKLPVFMGTVNNIGK